MPGDFLTNASGILWNFSNLFTTLLPSAPTKSPPPVQASQFFERQCDRFRKAGWNANQVQRRLARTSVFPEALSAEDATAVAKRYFPRATTKQAKRIAGVALLTVGYLSSIEHLRKRVDFLAKRRPAETEEALIAAALGDYIDQIEAPAKEARCIAAARLPHGSCRACGPRIFSAHAPSPVCRLRAWLN